MIPPFTSTKLSVGFWVQEAAMITAIAIEINSLFIKVCAYEK
jgi:hypothetical protein